MREEASPARFRSAVLAGLVREHVAPSVAGRRPGAPAGERGRSGPGRRVGRSGGRRAGRCGRIGRTGTVVRAASDNCQQCAMSPVELNRFAVGSAVRGPPTLRAVGAFVKPSLIPLAPARILGVIPRCGSPLADHAVSRSAVTPGCAPYRGGIESPLKAKAVPTRLSSTGLYPAGRHRLG